MEQICDLCIRKKNRKKNISASVCEGKRNESSFVNKTRWDTARYARNKVGLAAKFPQFTMERGRTGYLSRRFVWRKNGGAAK